MNKKLQTLRYISFDILSAAIVWVLFYAYRKKYIEAIKFNVEFKLEINETFIKGIILIPLFWLIIYYLAGYYRGVYKRSRLKELFSTVSASIIGVTILFFILILDDEVISYKSYYNSYFTLLVLHFVLTYIPRLILTTRTNHRIQNKKIGFETLIIGSNKKALQLYETLLKQKKSAGNIFVGFVSVQDRERYLLKKHLELVGNLHNLKNVITKFNIQEVIIALEDSEHDKIGVIMNKLEGTDVSIKIIPSMYDILMGTARMSSLFGEPLIQLSHDLMPLWEANVKRAFDVIVSVIAIILLSPLYIFLILGVRSSSKGPIFYAQERIGRFGKPFMIYKFRSMYVGSEKDGPALSKKNDNRITKFGLFMRKSRLDELPQFYNVLIGDMSLVGPRPERQFFIDQIVEQAPQFVHLHKVRPGITSWGQVKFGYAENVDEMIERLKYDIVYIENMSLYTDLKILIYTVKIILKLEGK
ncbi:MAG: sugar transferase [Bacteroidales bacterium]|nr:sugar transferase [Bacteroidales bacterium]